MAHKLTKGRLEALFEASDFRFSYWSRRVPIWSNPNLLKIYVYVIDFIADRGGVNHMQLFTLTGNLS